jgi:uncharacterized membrane protein YdjX (TVP38/TMEM64 family)
MVEFPLLILVPVFQSAIIYYVVGLTTTHWYNFVVFASIAVLMTFCGTSLGIFIASVFSELNVTLAVAPVKKTI